METFLKPSDSWTPIQKGADVVAVSAYYEMETIKAIPSARILDDLEQMFRRKYGFNSYPVAWRCFQVDQHPNPDVPLPARTQPFVGVEVMGAPSPEWIALHHALDMVVKAQEGAPEVVDLETLQGLLETVIGEGLS